MKRLMDRFLVIFLLRLILGGIFVYAGFTKVGDSQIFADNIASFQVLPPLFINMLALGLPPLEIILGVLVIGGWYFRSATLTLMVLTTVFIVSLLQALARGLVLDCGCLGQSTPGTLGMWYAVFRDILIMGGVALLYRSSLISLRTERKA